MQEITSTNNAKIKYIIQLQKKSSVRKKSNKFVIEGVRETMVAISSGYKIKSIFYYPELFSDENLFEIIKMIREYEVEIIKISKKVYQKIAYRNSTEGIIAVAYMKNHDISELKLRKNTLLLIAENIEKPGNIGAILRSVDGSGADGLILINPKTDLYNPNVIRSSIGTIFCNQVAVCNLDEARYFLQENQIKLFASTLQNSNLYFKENYTGNTAIAVGAEDKGLSYELRKISQQAIYIPMLGIADSLNVSVSAAILLYEAVQQRFLKK